MLAACPKADSQSAVLHGTGAGAGGAGGGGGGSGNAGNHGEDEEAKAHAAIAAANAAHYAALMDSCSGSSLPQSILAQSPSVMSEDNTLAKEMRLVEDVQPHVLQTSASFTGGMSEDNKDCEVTEVTVASEPTMILGDAVEAKVIKHDRI